MGKAAEATTVSLPTVADIVKGSAYALTIFPPTYVAELKLFLKGAKPYLNCLIDDKPRPAKPEEIVRQLYLRLLQEQYGYPKDRITLERAVTMGSGIHEKRADIVVSEKDAPDTDYICRRRSLCTARDYGELPRGARRKPRLRGHLQRVRIPAYST